ncbi:TPR Domain containing protein [Metarhizium acridum CQMa 102]|uniref:TPR Domain containing protein n=1 Tax=Metarhizium acridum (strain CQMa 102) TaxID=655827 RepID=E9E5G5_METAQ|nr:TPR Domain containing protein [Metarhizium acridum CQMa 102]EFY88848.1 TPR Domain containing protein [Metarhizium acridum CQMa 102]
MADLAADLPLLRETVDNVLAENDPTRVEWLYYIGSEYYDRFGQSDSMADLNMALQHFQEALSITPEDYEDRAERLETLGLIHQDRFFQEGEEADLDKGFQYLQEAVNITPEDDPERAGRLHHLGLGYQDRYERWRGEADLDMALHYFQQAVNIMPEDHADPADWLETLGIAYLCRFWRRKYKADLCAALQYLEEAAKMTPENDPDRAERLHSLGLGYQGRFHLTRDVVNINIALQYLKEAIDSTPENDPQRAERLHSLGSVYLDLHHRNQDKTDLNEAIQCFEAAINITSEDDPSRARRHFSLAGGYHDRFLSIGGDIGAEPDRDLAIQQYKDGLYHVPSHIEDRLRCSAELLTLCLVSGDWELASRAASDAVSLIPLLTPRFLENSDKQYLLTVTEVSGLASNAAAIALTMGKSPYEAVQLLELGRGVIIGSLNEMRADISELVQKHAQLAEEYVELRDQLNTSTRPVDQLGLGTAARLQVSRRHGAGQKLDKTIQAIRKLPGFDRFLMAPSEDELKEAAASGPVVIVNASFHRTDALIIEKHQIRSIKLLHVSDLVIENRAAALAEPESLDTHLLEWLWDRIAKPVLDALGFTQTPDDGCLPRMWWILTGPLAKFPIHAAGYHSRGTDTVLDRVISSYSSSVRALVQSRQESATLPKERGKGKAVLVSMETTPGHNHLPFVPLEMAKLERLCSSLRLQVCKPRPCRQDVLAALNDCDIFHFAGHGKTDPDDPSRSSLLLRGGPLAVADLFETNLHNRKPFLAYLSACGTGQINNDNLMNEALHLMAAYQAAGFRHVIGTLWEVNDKSCVEAANMTYEWVQQRNMADDSVSEGLHHATIKLRESWVSDNAARAARGAPTVTERARSGQGTVRYPRDAELCEEAPLYWVPYVHFGA